MCRLYMLCPLIFVDFGSLVTKMLYSIHVSDNDPIL